MGIGLCGFGFGRARKQRCVANGARADLARSFYFILKINREPNLAQREFARVWKSNKHARGSWIVVIWMGLCPGQTALAGFRARQNPGLVCYSLAHDTKTRVSSRNRRRELAHEVGGQNVFGYYKKVATSQNTKEEPE